MPLLSDYQRAALNVMGIPVWVSQTDVQQSQTDAKQPQNHFAPPAAAPAKPVASKEERSARLAALRAQVTSTESSGSKEVTSETTAKPSTRSLTAEETQAAGKLLSDIQLAAQLCDFTDNTLAFEIGTSLEVTSGRITFPVAPDKLTAKQKGDLWKALRQAQ